jgi:hypothetical protein
MRLIIILFLMLRQIDSMFQRRKNRDIGM